MKCSRVHHKKAYYDIYIGRPSKWGNPFSHKEDTLAEFKTSSRKESITKHKEWLLANEELMNDLHELKGKVLGCWCDEDKTCHGDILVELVNNLGNELF